MHEDSTKRRPVYTFAEQDYRFGAGPLRMSIEWIAWSSPIQLEDGIWYEVAGTEVSMDGRVIGPRQAQVRGSRLTKRNSP